MDPVKALNALAQETRLAIFRLLVRRGPEGMAAGALAESLDVAPSALSFHVRALAEAGLVTASPEGRFIHYAADLAAMQALVDFLSAECCEGHPERCDELRPAASRVWNVLVLCTGNSARSILAEALINAMSEERLRAWSAGSEAVGKVNPLALAVLEAQGLPTAGLRSKSWDEFTLPESPRFDLVITVCDSAARTPCPLWRGAPLMTHWSVPDPAAVGGSQAQREAAFVTTMQALRRRIALLLRVLLDSADAPTVQRQLDAIGRIDEVTV